MPLTFEEVPHEPIVIITYSDPYNPADIVSAFQQIADLAEHVPHIYVINDLSRLTLNFGDLTTGLKRASDAGPGSPSDPRTTHILVGTDEMVRFAADASHQTQYGGLDVKFYPSQEEALAFVRSLPQ